jgi:hypothetical protein
MTDLIKSMPQDSAIILAGTLPLFCITLFSC